MGTNYYAIIDCCDKCGRGSDEMHIGKSSGGWPFSLHVIEDLGLDSWAKWKDFLIKNQYPIRNEYGERVALDFLDDLIVSKRGCANEPHVLQAYKERPKYCKPCPDTGDKLTYGEFM